MAIAVCGLWLLAWAFIGGYAAWQQAVWSTIFIEESERGAPISSISHADEQASFYAEWVGTSLVAGLGVLPMVVTFAIGWWVLKGFIQTDNR